MMEGAIPGKAAKSSEVEDPESQRWMRDGLCQNVDPELFFPVKGGNGTGARRICRVCGVMQECLEFAVGRPGLGGIWGGTSEGERQKIRRTLDVLMDRGETLPDRGAHGGR